MGIGLQGARDERLVEFAVAEGRTIVTLDRDFATIMATTGATAPSIVHVRVERFNRKRAAQFLMASLPAIADALRNGCVATMTLTEVRVRALPIRV